ncbi:histone-lysine N-methyltransferase SMYD3 [Anoplophora glabripennis]|uniref:histone-lysine N-methyltransferase SMYD3 n=1 Tax=Anoplophora glabripennis TaxID=217634 RepID=UPI000875A57B|nr:histone-lysine N-methyltransferase SMYD3 [Anoplophora glabripennis]XP_018566238.1 histone-lysine N-methyltransferase SMYD3 [Anoplophora glabripennis]
MLTKKQPIPQGSVIIQEKPFVYNLSSKFRTERCDFCFKEGQLSKCSVCRYVYYCGRTCQKEAWTLHKLECQHLKAISPRILPDAARLLARLIKILAKGGDSIKSYYTEKNFRTFKDLMSHYTEIKNDTGKMEHLSSLYGVLFKFFDGEMLPNSADLMGMYGRMCVNSFSICNQELHSIGTGIYLAASVVDHSCKPNAVVTFEGTTLTMRALETLPVLDWSKIFISYIDVIALKKERQNELEANYYFLCQCPGCVGPEPIIEMTGAACPNKECGSCIDSSSIKAGNTCSSCDAVITEDFIKEYQDVTDTTAMHLENMKETAYLDVCKVFLKRHEGLLYKYNVKHVKMLDMAFESSIEFGKFQDATQYGLQLIKSYYKYYGKIHPMTGVLHLKLGKLLLHENNLRASLEHLKKAKEILEITHGITSPIFKEHLLPLYHQAVYSN